MKKFLTIIAIPLLLSACGGAKESTKIEALQKKDKNLSCKDILLEMNEAEYYRDTAHKNRGPKLKNILMPLGYVSTYMNAEEAIDAAEARVSYLDKIYQIMRCDEKDKDSVGTGRENRPMVHGENEYEGEDGAKPTPYVSNDELYRQMGTQSSAESSDYENQLPLYEKQPAMVSNAREVPYSPYRGGGAPEYAPQPQVASELPYSNYPGGSGYRQAQAYYRAVPTYEQPQQYIAPVSEYGYAVRY